MNYEVILLPALYALTILSAIGMLIKGISRTVTGIDGDGLKTVRWTYEWTWFRRAGYVLAVAAFVIPALVVTPPGHRGVIFSQVGGISPSERVEGLSFVFPYLQTPHQVNVRTQKVEIEAFAQTKDLQEVTVQVSLNFHIDPNLAAEIFQNLGADYADTVISPALLQRIDEEVGLVEALSFAQERRALSDAIVVALDDQLGDYGIVVERINIEDAIFDEAFIAAVKAKVIADEVAATELRLVAAAQSRADQVVKTAEGDAAAILALATAQAEANNFIAASLDAQLLTWQRITQWDGMLPETLLSGSEADLLLSIGGE